LEAGNYLFKNISTLTHANLSFPTISVEGGVATFTFENVNVVTGPNPLAEMGNSGFATVTLLEGASLSTSGTPTFQVFDGTSGMTVNALPGSTIVAGALSSNGGAGPITINVYPGTTVDPSYVGAPGFTVNFVGQSGAISFDEGSPAENIRSNRATVQSPIDNTKQGIVNLGSDTTQATTGASGDFSTILGGDQNVASAVGTTVCGGTANTAGGTTGAPFAAPGNDVVAGGRNNTANGGQSFVGGGHQNTASGIDSVIGGGELNVIGSGSTWTVIGGGNGNTIAGTTINSSDNAFIGAGSSNSIADNSPNAVICGGNSNQAGNTCATVVGGNNNIATGNSSTVGGQGCTVAGDFAAAFGLNCVGSSPHSFATGDTTTAFAQGIRVHSAYGSAGAQSADTTFYVQDSDATGTNFTDSNSNALLLRNGYAYTIRARVLATRQDTSGIPWAQQIRLLIYATGGSLLIAAGTIEWTDDPGSNGYVVSFTTPGGLGLQATFTGGPGQTVNASLHYDMVEQLGSGN
jgi:hypothetical protein